MPMKEPSRTPAFQASIDRVVQAFTQAEGDLSAALHKDVVAYTSNRFSGSDQAIDIPTDLVACLDKVALYAYKITDADVEKLQAAGYSDDAIFELTVGGSLGAGLATWEAGRSAVEAFFDGNNMENREDGYAA